ncbi:MAG: hypothetical protein FH753_00890 [Firmicutes bacterium]|nr:hypothetical protein [Bacillota bacterium]
MANVMANCKNFSEMFEACIGYCGFKGKKAEELFNKYHQKYAKFNEQQRELFWFVLESFTNFNIAQALREVEMA